MERWNDRPAEVAHLLNPAFVGAVLRVAVDGYVREAQMSMPFSLSFLVLPICLHKETADRLPIKVTVRLQQWIQDNRDVLINFPSRMRTLVPYSREGILFAAQRRVLVLRDDGSLAAGTEKLKGLNSYAKTGISVPQVMKRAFFAGRWLAISGSPTTLFSVLGVTP